MTQLGELAFFKCTILETVTLPKDLTTYGSGAFAECKKLHEIRVSAKNRHFQSIDGVLFSADGRTLIQFPKGHAITQYEISPRVTSIAERAFYGCTQLKSVTIPTSVTHIENEAFCRCRQFTSIKIPASVTYIGDYAFLNCRHLAYAEIPAGVLHIGKRAFYGHYRPLICGRRGSEAERYAKEEQHNFHEEAEVVLSRKELAKKLEKLGFEHEITDDSAAIVKYTGSASVIELPAGVTEIREEAFINCSRLNFITLPKSLKRIGEAAFCRCVSLTSIVIPDGVEQIEDFTFSECLSLTTVTFPPKLKSIGERAFRECVWLKSVTLPDSVTSIGALAFRGCESLAELTLLNSLTELGAHAFANCANLTTVTLPDGITKIGSGPFAECKGLTEILLTKENPHFQSIDGILFTADGKTLIQFPAGNPAPPLRTSLKRNAHWRFRVHRLSNSAVHLVSRYSHEHRKIRVQRLHSTGSRNVASQHK